jgi:hypothetical protein
MHRDRRAKVLATNPLKPNSQAKRLCMGLLDRELRQVRAKVIPNIKREAIQELFLSGCSFLESSIPTNRRLTTLLAMSFVHEVVNHTCEYVRGEVSTQGLENFWSLLKRTLRGTYVAVEPFHLDRYVS